jgi:hypothetical protein
MKKSVGKFVLAVAIGLAVSAVAHANNDDDERKGCSDSTLQGLYAFAGSGFNIVGGVAQPKAIVELIRFDGDGTLTVPAATVSINGSITRSPPGGTGTYNVLANCTGTIQFGTSPMTAPAFDLFVDFKDSEIQMIQTNPNTVFRGTAERVSR